jgi:hypothetical protein
MGLLEKFKLYHRAFQYWFRDDPAEIRYLQSRLKKGDVAIDIGAHKGGYTFWMRRLVGSSGRVIALSRRRPVPNYCTNYFNSPMLLLNRWPCRIGKPARHFLSSHRPTGFPLKLRW